MSKLLVLLRYFDFSILTHEKKIKISTSVFILWARWLHSLYFPCLFELQLFILQLSLR